MPSRSLHSTYIPDQHRCCGALISIGAYGDWHLCEACETLLSPRHAVRRADAIGTDASAALDGADAEMSGRSTRLCKRE